MTIPDKLLQLTKLKTLNLSCNRIIDVNDLSKFSNLKDLNLSVSLINFLFSFFLLIAFYLVFYFNLCIIYFILLFFLYIYLLFYFNFFKYLLTKYIYR